MHDGAHGAEERTCAAVAHLRVTVASVCSGDWLTSFCSSGWWNCGACAWRRRRRLVLGHRQCRQLFVVLKLRVGLHGIECELGNQM